MERFLPSGSSSASARWAVRGQRAPGGTALSAPMIVRFDYQVP